MAEKTEAAHDTSTHDELEVPGTSQTLTATPSREETLADKPEDEKRDVTRSPESNADADPEKGGAGVNASVQEGQDESRYLSGSKLFFLFLGLLLSIFLVALDQTIVATALPVIASHFNALDSVTWIVSAYFLTQVGLMLTIGQMLTIAPTKWIYLSVIALFEVGSLFCAVAWNMNFLIFGRAVAGVGASGIFISIILIIAQVTRLEQRPALFGAFGAVFALSSVVGPLLGGAFTDHVSWRWCFYINLPLGAISIVAISFLLTARDPPMLPKHEGKTSWQKWASIDWVGSVLSLGMICPLLLALQWGGNQYAWNDKAVIACFCVFGVVCPAFIYWEYRMGEDAIMPLSIFKRITVIGCASESFFVMFNLILGTYYLPLYYQAVKEHSATKSGLDILPFMIGIIGAAAVTGGIISFTGRYWVWLFCGPFLSAVGAGLLYTIDVNTSNARVIGYQILYGVGVGAAMQNAVIAVQCEFSKEEEMIPQATSILSFFQLLGGVLGIAIAGTVFANELKSNLAQYAPNLDAELAKLVRQSITVIFGLDPESKRQVVIAYVASLDWVFLIGVPTTIVAGLCALMVKNYNVKERGSQGGMAAI